MIAQINYARQVFKLSRLQVGESYLNEQQIIFVRFAFTSVNCSCERITKVSIIMRCSQRYTRVHNSTANKNETVERLQFLVNLLLLTHSPDSFTTRQVFPRQNSLFKN